jgi:hypothetical protein
MSEAAIEALAEGRHGDPFALLGPHRDGFNELRSNLFASHRSPTRPPALPRRTSFAWPISLPGLCIPP